MIILVAVTNDPLSPLTIPQFGVEIHLCCYGEIIDKMKSTIILLRYIKVSSLVSYIANLRITALDLLLLYHTLPLRHAVSYHISFPFSLFP